MTLISLQSTANGGESATVTFTSRQTAGSSIDGSACNNWQVTYFLVPQDAGYLIGPLPPGTNPPTRTAEPMVVPLAARWVAAAFGALLVLSGWQSVIGTLIVPRPLASWLTRLADRMVLAVYRAGTPPVSDCAGGTGFWLPRRRRSWSRSWWPGLPSSSSGSRCCCGRPMAAASPWLCPTPGHRSSPSASPSRLAPPRRVVFLAAATGMIVVALQIGYLPTLYAAFNRRETEVALLMPARGCRAGDRS